MIKYLTSNLTGVIHLIAALVAMITGMMVLVREKGTRVHKKTGYIYCLSMIVLNFTAFMIYRLYGKFGLFHYMALVSVLTLLAGMFPVLRRKNRNLYLHFSFMYWSVIGLYCAFVAEVFSRLPVLLPSDSKAGDLFYQMIGIGTTLVMITGFVFYIRLKGRWLAKFSRQKTPLH